jgi:hypothetical protein
MFYTDWDHDFKKEKTKWMIGLLTRVKGIVTTVARQLNPQGLHCDYTRLVETLYPNKEIDLL